MRTIGVGFLLIVAIALYALYSAAFTVNEAQQALVLRFGDARRVIQTPGLHWKVPIADNVLYLDDRILDLDSPVQEVIASDQKRLVVDAFARFRISDPLRFYQSVGTLGAAQARLATVLNSSLRRVLGEETFLAVVRDERDQLMQQITDQVNREAASFGVDVVDVRIRRADLPQSNSEAIYRRMQTEREQEAAQIRAEGEEQARRIRSRADREATILVAEAQRDAEETRGQGDALRNSIFANAYNRDPGFFDFYRSMQAYDTGLGGDRTRFVMRPDTDFFRYFITSEGAGGAAGATGGGLPLPGATDGDDTAPADETSGDEASGDETSGDETSGDAAAADTSSPGATAPAGGTTAPAGGTSSGAAPAPGAVTAPPGGDEPAAAAPAQ